MSLFENIRLYVEALKSNKKIDWPDLKDIKYVKGRLANFEDYTNGSATFFSVKSTNIPIERIEIPQYAYIVKHKFIKIPCIVIQAEGLNENTYMIGYKNLLNGNNEVVWNTNIELLGKEIIQ